ncbi:hypothetical protein ALC60_01723, partial [Trachymyrmex zeteki]
FKSFYFYRFADNIENTYCVMMLALIFHFGVAFRLNGFSFTIIFTDENVGKADIAKGYFLLMFLVILLMTTFLFCGAGELMTEQVSYTYNVY